MTKRTLVVAMALAVVAAILYLGYGSYGAKRAGASGEVYSNDTSSGRLKSSSDTGSSDTSSARAVSSSAPAASQPVTYPPSTEQSARTAAGTPASSSMPATDSISANPPNGEVFAGTGKYQLYRQGNITWRLDTDTGQTCIIFATDEEWKKAKVMNAGCRGR